MDRLNFVTPTEGAKQGGGGGGVWQRRKERIQIKPLQKIIAKSTYSIFNTTNFSAKEMLECEYCKRKMFLISQLFNIQTSTSPLRSKKKRARRM